MRVIDFHIGKENDKKQIKDFLRDFGVSSSLLTKLKQTENGITVNGDFAKSIETLSNGDILSIKIIETGKAPDKSDLPLEICYEDDDVLVVNKPPFMPVHESRNHRGDALSNAVSNYIDDNFSFRAVYRLDRDTSGLVLIAKNELAAAKLAGNIKKDYYAIVEGEYIDGGTINAPIKRLGESIIKRGVFEDGETAITHYEVVNHNNKYSLLKINLETGRTHQIRVHFSHLGTPLVGDTLYGKENNKIDRQALHCKTIYFTHPITDEPIMVDSDLPKEFKEII